MDRHLLSAADLSRDEALLVLDTAEEMALVGDRTVKKLPTLRGQTVVNLFFEDSTRTRTCFEVAAKRLSADVITFSAKGSSVSQGGEPQGHRAHAGGDGRRRRDLPAQRVAARRTGSRSWIRGSVAQRRRRHPRAPDPGPARRVHHAPRLGRLDGLRVTIVGDVLHSRVARSNVLLLSTLGASRHAGRAADPAARRHRGLAGGGLLRPRRRPAQERRRDDAAGPARADERRRSSRRCASTAAATASTPTGWRCCPTTPIVMHPGPMVRGMEIASEVADWLR